MKIEIREMAQGDTAVWKRMRHTLWPFTTPEEDQRDISATLASKDA